jgi:hypothetical protein
MKKQRTALPSRTAALADHLDVLPNALIQHLSDPWCFTFKGLNYFVLTPEEARSTCAQGMDVLLPDKIPARTLAGFILSLPYDEAIAKVEKLQRSRDREVAAENLLDLMDESWAPSLIETDGIDFWLEQTAHIKFLGRSKSFNIYREI